MPPTIHPNPFHFIADIYWCGIPLKCRHCKWLGDCRKPFSQGRKCYNGCIEAKILAKQQRERDREDYFDNLLKYAEENRKQQTHKNGKRRLPYDGEKDPAQCPHETGLSGRNGTKTALLYL